jgi:hypothetical protein
LRRGSKVIPQGYIEEREGEMIRYLFSKRIGLISISIGAVFLTVYLAGTVSGWSLLLASFFIPWGVIFLFLPTMEDFSRKRVH